MKLSMQSNIDKTNFLLNIDKDKNKTIYARITALTFNELPVETIEGRVTQGSINLDGDSALRRSCSLSLVAQDFNYNDYYWGLNTKFKLEIGVQNYVDKSMPDIIWFNQGIYLISSLNTSRNTTSFTMSLQGKDKMCLLNGEVSGTLESSVDFGKIEEEDENGNWIITSIPIPNIIREAVHQYAGEPYHNIIINDLETYGLELLEYRYDTPMYLYRNESDGVTPNYYIYTNAIIENNIPWYYDNNGVRTAIKLKDIPNTWLDQLVERLTDVEVTGDPVVFYEKSDDTSGYYLARISYGQTVGYRETDLTYAGDLIANIGESITSVLDKIKSMLSEFEYFYDLEGRFVFQKKRSFINTLWTPITEDNSGQGTVEESLALQSSYVYAFNEGELITAFNNNPNLLNLKNDYSIWGERESISGAKIPVHMRYAIDRKPDFYKVYDGTKFYSVEKKTDKELYDEIFKELYGDFQKKPNPNGLPEDWWDILDWAERYKMLKGVYPPGRMDQYCQFSADKSIDLNSYFPPGKKWAYQRNIQVFDVENDGTLGYFGHYDSCSHDYSYFLNRALTGQGTSYIYKPHIPLEEGGDIDDIIAEIMKSRIYNQDWREIIYQMSKDYYKNNQNDDFEIQIIRNNYPRYSSGKTGYEQYYIDIEGFWRQLYNPEIIDKTNKALKEKEEYDIQVIALTDMNHGYNVNNYMRENKKDVDQIPNVIPFIEELIRAQAALIEEYETIGTINYQIIADEENYLSRLQLKLSKLNTKLNNLKSHITKIEDKVLAYDNQKLNFYYPVKNNKNETIINYDLSRQYWNKAIWESPETLNFWFDFMDTDGTLSQFNVKNVGRRTKAINDTAIKSIYFREIPQVIFDTSMNGNYLTGYSYIQVPNIDTMFKISSRGKSAKDRLDELIYQHSYCIESATITSIPIYYLEPNTRIHLSDFKTNLEGDYIVSKITLPLVYNGTMSITATKAAESII